jgi:hypothetical protein
MIVRANDRIRDGSSPRSACLHKCPSSPETAPSALMHAPIRESGEWLVSNSAPSFRAMQRALADRGSMKWAASTLASCDAVRHGDSLRQERNWALLAKLGMSSESHSAATSLDVDALSGRPTTTSCWWRAMSRLLAMVLTQFSRALLAAPSLTAVACCLS